MTERAAEVLLAGQVVRFVQALAPEPRRRLRIHCVFAERRSLVYVLLEDLLTRGLLRPER